MKSIPKIIERVLRDWDNLVERMNECEASKCYPVSIVVADIDIFKEINDNFGHLFGDKIRKKRFGGMEEVDQVLQCVMQERIPHVLKHSMRLQERIIPMGVLLKLSESAMADLSICA